MTTSAALLLAAVLLAPLLAGAVHREAELAVAATLLLSLVVLVTRGAVRRRDLRGGLLAAPFLALLALTAAQCLPLPLGLRHLLDPASALFFENLPGSPPARAPLSLDPSETARDFARTAAALAAFLVALNVSRDRTLQWFDARIVAVAGALVLLVGMGHHLLGAELIYGRFRTTAGGLVGPFVNPNHTAELLELAAFAALAAAFRRNEGLDGKWAVLAVALMAGALATLSRGSVLALGVGAFVFVAPRRVDAEDDDEKPRRPWVASTASVLAAAVAVGGLALALGAMPLAEELASTSSAKLADKWRVWWDSWPILRDHPWGIGRRAFDRLYPVYRTLPSGDRYQFLENSFLQLLVDFGWLGCGVLLVSVAVLLRRIWPLRRADRVEVALLAGLAAVLTHNLVDFGLETLSIRVAFSCTLGLLIGRMLRRKTSRSDRGGFGVPAVAIVALGAGVAVLGFRAQDADALVRGGATPAERRERAIAAASVHPTDYFYPLLQARNEPVAPDASRRSPRLAALNRALRLCPGCGDIHVEVARTLWRLGRRPQALGAWRDAVRVAPQLLPSALAELDRSGARPSELASLAAGGAADPLATARYLLPKKAEPEVLALIETAKDLRAPVGEVDLLRVDLLLTLDHVAEAKRLLDERWAGMSNDPRAHATRSIVEERLGDPGAALRTVRAGLDRDPGDLALAHRQLELVRRQKLWRDLDAALATLRASQRARGVAPVEYHLTAGAAYLDRGSFGRARTEYREAVELSPNNPNLWRLLGEASERVEDRAAAAEAYARALELLGHDEPALRAALDRTKR